MKFSLSINQQDYVADTQQGESIAITLLPNGLQPNHFGASACTSETLVAGDFIGDTKRGGSCNVNQLTIIPHCNGTHTESVSHIVNQLTPVYQAIDNNFFAAVLISVTPIAGRSSSDSYKPSIEPDNLIIDKAMLENSLSTYSNEELIGLIIRTLPNKQNKKSTVYDDEHYPPFITNDGMKYLVERQVKHLMVDFPSVDNV